MINLGIFMGTPGTPILGNLNILYRYSTTYHRGRFDVWQPVLILLMIMTTMLIDDMDAEDDDHGRIDTLLIPFFQDCGFDCCE